MPIKNERKIVYPKGGMLEDVTLRIKLILRLMADGRVSIFLKALPVFSLVYFLVPDLILGPFDDVAVIWLGAYLFVELCPPEIVQEHVNALRSVIPGEWHDAPDPDNLDHERLPGEEHDFNTQGDAASVIEDESIVDAEFWEKKDE